MARLSVEMRKRGKRGWRREIIRREKERESFGSMSGVSVQSKLDDWMLGDIKLNDCYKHTLIKTSYNKTSNDTNYKTKLAPSSCEKYQPAQGSVVHIG